LDRQCGEIMDTAFFHPNTDFSFLGIQHVLVVLFFLFAGMVLIRYARGRDKPTQNRLFFYLAWLVSSSIIVWTLLKWWIGPFDIKEDLPLHLCNFLALILPVFAIYRRFWMYEILVFWILAGTTQAILTPDLSEGFPHVNFFKYWLEHAGLVVFIIYATLIYDMRPTVKSIFKSFGAIQIYFIAMIVVNAFLGSNYLFISRKPDHASLLDAFGDWPYYILAEELIMLPYFFVIYLLLKRSSRVRSKELA